MIRTPDVAVTVTDGLLWLLNAVDGTPVLSYEVNRNKARARRVRGACCCRAALALALTPRLALLCLGAGHQG
jgi:hypothetical protein